MGKHHSNLCKKYLDFREGRRYHVLPRSAATLCDAQQGRGGVADGCPHPDAAKVCQADGGPQIQHLSRGCPGTAKGIFDLSKSPFINGRLSSFNLQNVKRMLLLDYPYPAVMDKEVAQNREGVNSKV